MIWSGLGHTTSGKAVPSAEQEAADAACPSDVEMMPVDPALATPASPAVPPPPAPSRVPPPPGTALAALFPYVVPELDAT
eukprot:4201744-Prorocentrum_lima.AAC.1